MTFKATSITFLFSLLLVGALYYFLGISLWWFVLPIFIYKITIVYGAATIQSNFYVKAFCNGDSTVKKIAITFDDGPNKEYTQKVLSLLSENNVKAIFFVIGKNIIGNESLLKQINAEGHTIGNHTFSHSFFIDFKNAKRFKEELNKTSDLVFNIIGKRMKLFRPPYGVTTPHLAKAAKQLNYNIIGWNVRSLDTTKDKEEIIAERVLQQIKPGAIILFHDTSEKTLNVLKQTINFAKENGFKIVSLEQLLTIKSYE